MAGGGVKGGHVHGATDELGFHAVENRHFVTDVHATILNLKTEVRAECLRVRRRKALEFRHFQKVLRALRVSA
jgi:hypothetical protein